MERFFELGRLGSSVRQEVVAGVTTFLAMSYIVAVNPAILSDAGMPPHAVAVATCLVSGLGTIAMGLWARVPIAVAPGMGLNAFFAYSIVQGAGLSWQQGLGLVCISGICFVLLTLVGARQALFRALPMDLLPAIGSGIGMFLVVIGMRNAGMIRAHDATLVTRGDLTAPPAILAIATILLIATLLSRGVRAGLLIGIGVATLISIPLGLSPTGLSHEGGPLDTLLQLQLPGALSWGTFDLLLALLFVDLFDSLGTMVGVITKAGLRDDKGEVPRLGRMLGVDGGSTIVGALAGTSTVTSYIESAAGIDAGGRSGLTSIVTGTLFLLSIPAAAVVTAVPSAAAAAALIVIGAKTVGLARLIDWDDIETALPALFIVAGMPLTFSISDGLAMGVISFVSLKVLRGRADQVRWAGYLLAGLFVARYVVFD